jgi:hypothetical protein
MMHFNIKGFIFCLLLVSMSGQFVHAQNLQVFSEDDVLARELQLKGDFSDTYSFTIRPLKRDISHDSLMQYSIPRKLKQDFLPGKLSLQPLRTDVQFNSDRPFGWNNGSMIAARGLQYRVSTGLFFNSKILEVNLQPEYVNASNLDYKRSNQYGNATSGPYKRIFLGQSYAQVKVWNVGLGFSNENIWWGPGQNNALIFSNNAPGFGHLHFSTTKPIKTPVASFEFQVIAGGLDQDTTINSESFRQQPAPYTRKWRYVNGIVFSIQPKFIPGLHVGFTRAFQFYGNNIDTTSSPFLEKYLPAVNAFFKKKINTQADAPGEDDQRDQVASLFMRFLMPKNHFEFYVEYGFNDFKANTRDLIQDVQHSSAYLAGFKKVFTVSKEKYYTISGEIVQMAQSTNYVVRNAGNWYTSGAIKQGFTHMNQILGAGSGLGNNVQSLAVDRVDGLNRLGLKVQRIQNDPRAQLASVNQLWLSPIAWNDFVWGPTAQWTREKLLVRGELQFVHSKNYAWMREKKFNLFSSINLIYKL